MGLFINTVLFLFIAPGRDPEDKIGEIRACPHSYVQHTLAKVLLESEALVCLYLVIIMSN